MRASSTSWIGGVACLSLLVAGCGTAVVAVPAAGYNEPRIGDSFEEQRRVRAG